MTYKSTFITSVTTLIHKCDKLSLSSAEYKQYSAELRNLRTKCSDTPATEFIPKRFPSSRYNSICLTFNSIKRCL